MGYNLSATDTDKIAVNQVYETKHNQSTLKSELSMRLLGLLLRLSPFSPSCSSHSQRSKSDVLLELNYMQRIYFIENIIVVMIKKNYIIILEVFSFNIYVKINFFTRFNTLGWIFFVIFSVSGILVIIGWSNSGRFPFVKTGWVNGQFVNGMHLFEGLVPNIVQNGTFFWHIRVRQ